MTATVSVAALLLTLGAGLLLQHRHRRQLAADQAWADQFVPVLRSMRADLRDTRELEHAHAAGMTRHARAAARGDRRADIRWRRWLVRMTRWARDAGYEGRLP